MKKTRMKSGGALAVVAGLLCLLAAATVEAQDRAQQPPRSQLDITLWGVVYDVPATKQVKVRSGVPYLSDARGTLAVDIYLPPDMKAGEKRPAVLFVNAVGDSPQGRVKDWEIYRSWPRLVAAHGLIGVSMDADGERIQESLRGAFDFLSSKGAEYGIDGERLGLYAASANVSGTTRYLASEHAAKGIRAAALYYGRVPEGNLRKDLAVLFIVAESDSRGANRPLKELWQRVVESNVPWTLLFASDLPHAFDAASDNDAARRIIQQTLAFWKSNLEPVPQPPWQPSNAREIIAANYANTPRRASELLAAWVKENPEDRAAHMQYGRALMALRRFDEAEAAYRRAQELGESGPGFLYSYGDLKFRQQKFADAVDYLTRAIEGGVRHSLAYGNLAYAQLRLGRNEEAIKSYEKSFEAGIPPGANTRGVAHFNMACAYARLGQKDKALGALASAVAEGFNERRVYETDEDLAALRADARFQEILARLPKP